jgi:hypothetical protein
VAINILDQALRMSKQNLHFAFTQNELKTTGLFWDNLSDTNKVFLRRMIHEGRFEVATGMYVQPHVAIDSQP